MCDEDDPSVCPFPNCERIFLSEEKLVAHKIAEHGEASFSNSEDDSDEESAVCDICTEKFESLAKLSEHKTVKHAVKKKKRKAGPASRVKKEESSDSDEEETNTVRRKPGPKSKTKPRSSSDEEQSHARSQSGPTSKTKPQISSDEEQNQARPKPGPKSQVKKGAGSSEDSDCKDKNGASSSEDSDVDAFIKKTFVKETVKNEQDLDVDASEKSMAKEVESDDDSDVDAFKKCRDKETENGAKMVTGGPASIVKKPSADDSVKQDSGKQDGDHVRKAESGCILKKDSLSSDDSDVDTFKKEIKNESVKEETVVKVSLKSDEKAKSTDERTSKDERNIPKVDRSESKDKESKDHKKKHKHKFDEKDKSKEHKKKHKEKNKERGKEKNKERDNENNERDKENNVRDKEKSMEHEEGLENNQKIKTIEVQERAPINENVSVLKKVKENSDDSSDDEARNKLMADSAKKSWKEISDLKNGKLSSASRRSSVDTDEFLASEEEGSPKQKKKSPIGLKDLIKKVSPFKGDKRKRDSDSDGEKTVVKKKKEKDPNRTYNTAKGSVNVTGDVDGPVCFKCDQVCKDKSNLKNHVLSHYYDEFYKLVPDSKPYSCPECEHPNRDRITLVRHYAFTHKKIFDYVTEDQLGMNLSAPRKPRPPSNKPKVAKEPKEPKIKKQLDSHKSKDTIDSDDSSDDEASKKIKQRIESLKEVGPIIKEKTYEKPDVDKLRKSLDERSEHKKHKKEKKHKKHKEHRQDRDNKDHNDRDNKDHKEHKKHKKEKKEKRDKERHKSTDVKSPLSHLLKEMTPSSDNSEKKIIGAAWSGEPEDEDMNLPCPVMAMGRPFTPPGSGRPSTPPGSPPPSGDNSTPVRDEKEDTPTNTNINASDDSEDDFDLPAPVFAV